MPPDTSSVASSSRAIAVMSVESAVGSGSVRDAKEKSQRNVELLRAQAAESPKTPFLHFNLGSEYILVGDVNAAIEELQAARSLLTAEGNLTRVEYVPSLFTRLVMALRMAGKLIEATTIAAEGLEMFPQFTDLVIAQARIAQMQGDTDKAVALFHRAIDMGEAPARYGPMVGSGTFLARLALAELYLDLGEFAEARVALQWCVDNHPEFLAVAGPYASAMLRDGAAPNVVTAELGKLDALPAGKTPTKRDWERLSRSWRRELDERIATLESIRGRLTTCIGCGCLSLRTCALLNPDDEAGSLGGGAHYLRKVSPRG